MSERYDADARFLETLQRSDLIFVRTADDRSVVVERDGRRVLVACTERETLGAWWREHAGVDAPAPFVRELPFRQIVGLWASQDVELLIDPGPASGVVVPIDAARRHLGLGPTIVAGDGSDPLPFAGLSGGKRTLRMPALIGLLAVVLLIVGLAEGQVTLIVCAVLVLTIAGLSMHRNAQQIRAGIQANRRLTQSQRRRSATNDG